jgi:hypothetical protein
LQSRVDHLWFAVLQGRVCIFKKEEAGNKASQLRVAR